MTLATDIQCARATELVFEFLEDVREEYEIGLFEFIAVQELLLRLAERGAFPNDPALLEGYLCPIVASNRREQQAFAERYQTFLSQRAPRPLPPIPSPNGTHVQSFETFRFKSLALNAGLSVLVVAVLIALAFAWTDWMRQRATTLPGVPPSSTVSTTAPSDLGSGKAVPLSTLASSSPSASENTAPETPAQAPPRQGRESSAQAPNLPLMAAVVSLLFLGALLWRSMWLRQRAQTFLKSGPQDAVATRLDAESLLIGLPLLPMTSLPQLRSAGTALRARRPASIQELDLAQSVRATARNAGFFSEVHRELTRIPEYLFLLDRRHPDDFDCARHDELLDQLANGGVKLTRLYFDGDATVVQPRDPLQRARRLRELESTFHAHRVAIVADPELLFDSVTDNLATWVTSLLEWSRPVLLTSSDRQSFLPCVKRLRAAGIRIVEASADGLIGAFDSRPRSEPIETSAEVIALPSTLRGDSRAWLSPEPPDSALVSRCLNQLRFYLGKNGYAWLAACAHYPQLRWSLAVAIAQNLGILPSSATSPSTCRFTALPWMRAAHLPRWLRLQLLAELPAVEREQVRRAVEQILVGAAVAGGSMTSISAFREEAALVRALYRELARTWENSPNLPSPLEDSLYLSATEDALSVRVQRTLRGVGHAITRHARAELPERDVIQCAYGGLLLGYFSQYIAGVLPLRTSIATLVALFLAVSVAESSRIDSHMFGRRGALKDVLARALVVLSAVFGAALYYINFGFYSTPRTAISNALLCVQCFVALGLPLAVFQRTSIRVLCVCALLGLSAIYKTWYSAIPWDLAIPWHGLTFERKDLGYTAALAQLLPLLPTALALAVFGWFLDRIRLRPVAAVRTMLHQAADRFALDRLLFDRNPAEPLPAGRIRASLAAIAFGVVVGSMSSIDWADSVIWLQVLAFLIAIAFCAYPYITAIRARAQGRARALGRSAYEMALVTITALTARTDRNQAMTWLLPTLAAVSVLGTIVIQPTWFPRLKKRLERSAPDRFLGTRPAFFGIAYLDIFAVSLMTLFHASESHSNADPAIGPAPPSIHEPSSTIAGGMGGASNDQYGIPPMSGAPSIADVSSHGGAPVSQQPKAKPLIKRVASGATTAVDSMATTRFDDATRLQVTDRGGRASTLAPVVTKRGDPGPNVATPGPTYDRTSKKSDSTAQETRSKADNTDVCLEKCKQARIACVGTCSATGESNLDFGDANLQILPADPEERGERMSAPNAPAPVTPIAPSNPIEACTLNCNRIAESCANDCRKELTPSKDEYKK